MCSYVGNSRKPKNIKFHNQRLVLSLLREVSSASASEISEKIGLSITTVTKILAILLEKRLIKSIGKGNSTEEGGKKPELFALNESYKYAIGCYVSDDQFEIFLSDLLCGEIDTCMFMFSEPNKLKTSMQEVADCIRKLVEKNGMCAENICGISVGFDGIVDADRGILYYPIHNTDWGRNIFICDILHEMLPEYQNIIVDNGGRYGAYSIFLEHPEYKEKKIFSILFGDNAVGAFFDNGKIRRGANGFIGEVGHMSILPNYRRHRCLCGCYGCFETLIKPEAVLDYAKEIGREWGDAELYPKVLSGRCGYQDIFDASEQGNEYACRVVDQVASYFSLVIRNLMMTCDPELILISGIYGHTGSYFEKTLKNMIQKMTFFRIEGNLKIKFVDSGITWDFKIGAAYYMIDQYMKTLEFT